MRRPFRPPLIGAKRPLLWGAYTNRHQRGVGWARRGTAGSASFTQELRLVSGRPAIGRDQDFVVLALNRASRDAVRLDHPHARARWTLLALRSLRTGRAGWTERTRRA